MSSPGTALTAGANRSIGPIGTALRVCVAVALLFLAVTDVGGDLTWSIDWWQILLGLVGFPLLLTSLQRLRLRYTQAPLRETSHLGFCLNLVIGAALVLFPPTRAATLLFLGASLLVAAWRGYAGCESLAISNWLLRREDTVGCVLFSPIDEGEKRLTGR